MTDLVFLGLEGGVLGALHLVASDVQGGSPHRSGVVTAAAEELAGVGVAVILDSLQHPQAHGLLGGVVETRQGGQVLM